MMMASKQIARPATGISPKFVADEMMDKRSIDGYTLA